MISVTSVLFLVFLEPNAVGQSKVRVVLCVVYGVPESSRFGLCLGLSGVLESRFVMEGRGKVGESGEGHLAEVFGPLGGLGRLPVRREMLFQVWGGSKSSIPVNFA